MRERLHQLALRTEWLRPWAPYFEEDYDWTGARNFLLSMFWLSIALVLALNGAAAFERGEMRLTAIYHTVALSLAAYVSVRLVPAMARGTPLKWLFYNLEYEFARGSAPYISAALIIGLAAVNTGNNLLFLVCSSLLAGLLLSAIVSRVVLTGIELKLELPDHIFARQPVLASLTLENLKMTLPSYSLLVSGDSGKNAKARQAKAKARDRHTTSEDRRVLRQPVYFPYIPRYRHSTQQVELVFPRRGRYQQGAFRVSSKFPFGLLLKTRQLPASSEVVVYPPVEPTEEFYEILPLISGEMESYYRGRGHDLYS
ncbi:MAG: hypothetical protein ACRD35_05650, partial [Candidatus Acidiferrales bacterium]